MSPYITIIQVIFHFLWDHWAHFGIFENEVLLMYALVLQTLLLLMKSFSKAETPIF